MKKIYLFLIMAISIYPAAAFRIEYGKDIVISQPVNENLYIMGGKVTINAPIHGDLIIAGGTIVINDSVTNDINIAGGEITFNGWVGGDIRCAGGKMYIRKNVLGEVVITGGNIMVDKGIEIGGLLASGGNITINGNVNGKILGAFGEFSLNGNVLNDVDLRGGHLSVNGLISGNTVMAARTIVLGESAAFKGNIRYWNKQGTLGLKNNSIKGKALFDPSLRIRTGEWYYLGAVTIFGFLWYIGMALLMIAVVLYLFSATIKKAALTAFSNSLQSLGVGFLFFILIPMVAVIALFTIIGVPVGILLFIGYILLLLLSTVITSVVGANWINNQNNFHWNLTQLVLISIIIFVVLKLLTFMPFFGWFVMALLVCISFGAILLNVNWKGKRPQKVAE
jgi:cytoskeletal protein CcmA (bactofilin family)